MDAVRANVQKVNANAKNAAKSTNGISEIEKITSDVTKIFTDLKTHLENLTWEEELMTWDDEQLKKNFPKESINATEQKNNNQQSPAKQQQLPNKGTAPNKNQSNANSNNAGFRSSSMGRPNLTNRTISASNQSKPITLPNEPSMSQPLEEQLIAYKQIVLRAKKQRKTFTVCGNFQAVRRALLSRGWVEKVRIYQNSSEREFWRSLEGKTLHELLEGIANRERGYANKRVLLSKLLGPNHQVDFFWDLYYDAFKVNDDKIKDTIINRFRRNVFTYTSKQGLCEGAKNAYWYHRPGVSKIRHPRAYPLLNKNDTSEFIDNYRLTAAISLMKWTVHTHNEGIMKIISPTGKIPLWAFHFALSQCRKQEMKLKHEDIDSPIEEAETYEWDKFLQCFYQLVHVTNHFKEDTFTTAESLVLKASMMLKRLREHEPHLDMDGMLNMWILKPIGGSQGVGISVCQTLDYILETVRTNNTKRFIVQKYIERPLLIYKTKFDIRQWFLISSTMPLTIWIYKVCYLRFSSQTYNLRKLHRAIHLTNNSVQCHFKSLDRDKELPECNMWDSDRFKKYLESIGHADKWKNVIYPGMREGITAAILINQEHLDYRRNTFELYGADFMLTEDFVPWLIEINSRPALYASTSVTARLCPMVLEDTIKVIIDKQRNVKAPTGLFELLYKEKSNIFPTTAKDDLTLAGVSLPTDYFSSSDTTSSQISFKPSRKISKIQEDKESKIAVNQQRAAVNNNVAKAKEDLKTLSEDMKSTLGLLLDLVQTEKNKRKPTKISGEVSEKTSSVMTSLQNLKRHMSDMKQSIRQRDVKNKLPAVPDDGNLKTDLLPKIDLKNLTQKQPTENGEIMYKKSN